MKMKHLRRAKLVAILTVLGLLTLPTAVLGSTVTLISGASYDAELAGFFTFGGENHLVFAMADGSLMSFAQSEVVLIQLGSSSRAQSQPPAVAQPPAAATPPVPPQPEYVRTEREPNNDAASANLIAPGTNITGAVSTTGDTDMYRISVATHGSFHVTCTQPADFYLEILDSSGYRIAGDDCGGAGSAMVLDGDVFRAGDYFVVVRGYSSGYTSDTPYSLRAEFREARDAFEPNDSIQQASPVVSGRQFDSFIYRPDDVDYYRIDVTGPTSIKVTSTQPEDYYLSIVDGTGKNTLYGGDLGSVGTNMLLEGEVFEPGTYFVVMRGYSSSKYNMHTPYSMTISLNPGGIDRYEPNDRPEQAATPPLGQTFASFIDKPGDDDYYKINITGPSQIVIESDQPSDYHLSLLDRDGRTVIEGGDFGNAGSKMQLTRDVFDPGTYYVLMRGYGSSIYNMHVPYNMKITVKTAIVDAAEPNDSASQAKGLQLGRTVTGVVSTAADQDWWFFDAPILGKVRINCTQPADFLFRIVDSSGKEITSHDLGGKGVVADVTMQLAPMMRYFVVVQPYSSSGFNVNEAYQLTVSPSL